VGLLWAQFMWASRARWAKKTTCDVEKSANLALVDVRGSVSGRIGGSGRERGGRLHSLPSHHQTVCRLGKAATVLLVSR